MSISEHVDLRTEKGDHFKFDHFSDQLKAGKQCQPEADEQLSPKQSILLESILAKTWWQPF